MIDKKIDINGDMVLSAGTFVVIDEDDETEQHLRHAIRHLLGEWFLDPAGGLRLFQAIVKKQYNEPQAAREIRRTVGTVQGIAGILRLKLTPNESTRVLNLDLKVITDNARELYFQESFSL